MFVLPFTFFRYSVLYLFCRSIWLWSIVFSQSTTIFDTFSASIWSDLITWPEFPMTPPIDRLNSYLFSEALLFKSLTLRMIFGYKARYFLLSPSRQRYGYSIFSISSLNLYINIWNGLLLSIYRMWERKVLKGPESKSD